MNHDEIRALLPQHKLDIQRAEALVALGYPAVAPVLPELTTWLQDYNWPVAQVLSPFLASIGAPLIPLVREILMGDDAMWKYWTLSCIVDESPTIFVALYGEVQRLALNPSDDEDIAAVRERAREILERYREITRGNSAMPPDNMQEPSA